MFVIHPAYRKKFGAYLLVPVASIFFLFLEPIVSRFFGGKQVWRKKICPKNFQKIFNFSFHVVL